MRHSRLPARVLVNDSTLREGEQSADVAFSNRDNERIASLLEEVGVGRPQLSFAPAGADEQAETAGLIRRIQRAQTELMVTAFLRRQLRGLAEGG